MDISDSLYFQFLNQRNMEYTLSHIYRLKAENEENPIIKLFIRNSETIIQDTQRLSRIF